MTLPNRLYWYVGALLLFIVLVILLRPILMPFAVAALFAYLTDPLADKLEARKLSRTLSVVIIFAVMSVVFLVFVLLVVPLLGHQLVDFIHALPEYLAMLQAAVLPWLEHKLGIQIDGVRIEEVKTLVKNNWQYAGGIATEVVKNATASTMSLVTVVANVILIPVVSFYLLRDWDKIMAWLQESLPRDYESLVMRLVRESDEVLSAFIRGQLLVMTALGIIYSIGLGIIGLDLALFLGALAGLASVVPYLGAIVGICSASVMAYLQFGAFMPVVYVWVVFGIGQLLEGMFLTPVLVGDKIGLHPVAVIFAIMAGGQLAGFVGILVALPVAAVAMVFLRYLHEEYRESHLYLTIEQELSQDLEDGIND